MFEVDDRTCIIAPEDCGLINSVCTLNGWLDDVAELRGFFAPPLYSHSFRLRIRFNNRMVRALHYTWHPAKLTRTGTVDGLRATSELVLMKRSRIALMRVTVRNTSTKPRGLEVQYESFGKFGRRPHWFFGQLSEEFTEWAEKSWEDGVLAMRNGKGEMLVASTLDAKPSMPVCSGVLNCAPNTLQPGASLRFYTVVSMGDLDENAAKVRRALENPEQCFQEALDDWREREKFMLGRMPRLESDNAQLVRYYNRSLLHLLLNEWQVPEFKLHPHYGTGSVMGDTICCYMWNYGGPYRLWSLLSPKSAKEHLLQILSLDLGNCYAFFADDGVGFGPYYPINQEKAIFLAHAYVLQTGDTAFLEEDSCGRTVIERLVELALHKDDTSVPATLADYGTGNDHLELRGPDFATNPMSRYDGLCPDLNLRRCVNFHLVDELCRICGFKPQVDLAERGRALKKLVHDRLFSKEKGWFRTIDPEGREVFRYTIQMFKALGWGGWAMEPEDEEALVRHLMDEDEFLGRFGMHSLSKKDPAYYENDVDNGGPGACVSFPAAIIQRLYQSGRAKEAEEIWKRLLWMADDLPYWGDSQRGDVRDYRRITALKCDIEGAEPAQALMFGMFGVRMNPDFSLELRPMLPSSCRFIRLRGLRLAGRSLDIYADAERTEVRVGRKTFRVGPGEAVTLPPPQGFGTDKAKQGETK